MPTGIFERTSEYRKKMSKIAKQKAYGKWMKGKKISEEAKLKISMFNKGKKLSSEHRKKISEAHKGMKHSEETKFKISKNSARRGKPTWNQGKEATPDHKEKLRIAHLGHVLSLETRRKMSEIHLQKAKDGKNPMQNPEIRKRFTGKNSPSWKGGITPLNHKIRTSLEYKLWQKTILKNDDYRCFDCGERGGELNVHHIYSFSQYPRLRLDINNGRTLCIECHKKTFTFHSNQYVKTK